MGDEARWLAGGQSDEWRGIMTIGKLWNNVTKDKGSYSLAESQARSRRDGRVKMEVAGIKAGRTGSDIM